MFLKKWIGLRGKRKTLITYNSEMPDDEKKRAGMNRLRLLVKDSAQTAVTSRFGHGIKRRRLEDEVMKIVRSRWKEQSCEIRHLLEEGEHVGVEMLVPWSNQMVEPAAVVDVGGAEVGVADDVVEPDGSVGDIAGSVQVAENADGEDALDSLLQKCTGAPKGQEREHGIKVHIAERRAELLTQVRDQGAKDHKERDNAVRRLGRQEFDLLFVDEQWALCMKPLKEGRGHGGMGKFIADAALEGPGEQADAEAEAAGVDNGDKSIIWIL